MKTTFPTQVPLAVLYMRNFTRGFASLLCGVVLLAAASGGRAGNITYNIVDYPANEVFVAGSGTDTVSGTIITDGTIGPLSAANIIGGTFSFAYEGVNLLTGTSTFGNPIGLQATSTQLLLDPGVDSSFSIATSAYPVGGGALSAGVVYENYLGGGVYYGGYSTGANVLYPFDTTPLPAGSGSIAANSSWVIGTVPEPTSLTLLLPAILVFGVIYLRRRRMAWDPAHALSDAVYELNARQERLRFSVERGTQDVLQELINEASKHSHASAHSPAKNIGG